MNKNYTPAVFGCLVLGTLAGMAVALLTTAAPVAEARTPQGTAQRIFQELEDRCDCNTQVLVELELIIAELNEDCECEEEGEVCGDGVVDSGEECDDGNNTPGDGCSADCNVELGACCIESVPSAVYSLYVFEEDFFTCEDDVTRFDCEQNMGGFWQGPDSVCDDECIIE